MKQGWQVLITIQPSRETVAQDSVRRRVTYLSRKIDATTPPSLSSDCAIMLTRRLGANSWTFIAR